MEKHGGETIRSYKSALCSMYGSYRGWDLEVDMLGRTQLWGLNVSLKHSDLVLLVMESHHRG